MESQHSVCFWTKPGGISKLYISPYCIVFFFTGINVFQSLLNIANPEARRIRSTMTLGFILQTFFQFIVPFETQNNNALSFSPIIPQHPPVLSGKLSGSLHHFLLSASVFHLFVIEVVSTLPRISIKFRSARKTALNQVISKVYFFASFVCLVQNQCLRETSLLQIIFIIIFNFFGGSSTLGSIIF